MEPPKSMQSSIHSFFKPRVANYTAPPSSHNSDTKAKASIAAPLMPPLEPATIISPSQNADSSPGSTKPLPPQASISNIHEKHIQPLRRINSLLLCITYPDSFYHKVLEPSTSPNFSRVLLWQGAQDSEPKVVGGIICRVEQDEESKTSSIYIQSLALLSPYRRYGLATAALEAVIASVVAHPKTSFPITSLYAHVWTDNTEGSVWYTGRGFTKEEPAIQGYYRRLKPDTAWIFRRLLRPSDHIRNADSFKIQPLSQQISAISAPPSNGSAESLPPQSAVPRTLRPPVSRGSSYQSMRPETEWNDLPSDILVPSRSSTPKLTPNQSTVSMLQSEDTLQMGSSSRSSSKAGGKKKRRDYPELH